MSKAQRRETRAIEYNAAALTAYVVEGVGDVVGELGEEWAAELGGMQCVDIQAQDRDDEQRMFDALMTAHLERKQVTITQGNVSVMFAPERVEIIEDNVRFVRVWYGGGDSSRE